MNHRLSAIALLVPAALLLSACQSTNTVEVSEGGALTLTMDMVDSTSELSSLGLSCSDLEGFFGSDLQDLGDGSSLAVEDISSDGVLGCRFMGTSEDAVDGMMLIDNGDTYTLNLTESDLGVSQDDLSELSGVDFSLRVIMPGNIVSASGNGTVSGNSVTYTDWSVMAEGLTVTGLQTSSPSNSPTPGDTATSDSGASGSSGATNDESPAQSNSSSVPTLWILLGVVGIAAIAVVVLLVTRRKSDDPPNYPQNPYPQNPYPQNPYPQNPYPQNPQNPYPQNPYPQNPQNPYPQNPPYQQGGAQYGSSWPS